MAAIILTPTAGFFVLKGIVFAFSKVYLIALLIFSYLLLDSISFFATAIGAIGIFSAVFLCFSLPKLSLCFDAFGL